jgi:heparosan-N-sulfate-glucuronate 5-epimerase
MSTGHFADRKKKIRRTELKIITIKFNGQGAFDNLTISTTEHLSHFYDAAEWMLENQNQDGGYPIPVKRKLGPGFDDLNKGWLSAMSQGHAISLLSRAYFHSGQTKYLTAAINALKPFRIPSYQGGVLATFLGKFVWYEEYPTSPHSFVLNGFIYSLLGLYDLHKIAPKEQSKEALALFDQGMVSLKKLLTLFDTGSGTTYDLRHFTLGELFF